MSKAEIHKVVRVGRKGVIIIPKPARDALCIKEGSVLELMVRGDEIIIRLLDPIERARCRELREEAERKSRELEERLGIRRRTIFESEELIPWWEKRLRSSKNERSERSA